MKQKPTRSHWDENETCNLLAAFGIKVSHEQKEELATHLRAQKEVFMDQERRRAAQEKGRDNLAL